MDLGNTFAPSKKFNTYLMKKIAICIVIGITLTSCSSGWSCKGRYVKIESKKQAAKNTKDC